MDSRSGRGLGARSGNNGCSRDMPDLTSSASLPRGMLRTGSAQIAGPTSWACQDLNSHMKKKRSKHNTSNNITKQSPNHRVENRKLSWKWKRSQVALSFFRSARKFQGRATIKMTTMKLRLRVKRTNFITSFALKLLWYYGANLWNYVVNSVIIHRNERRTNLESNR